MDFTWITWVRGWMGTRIWRRMFGDTNRALVEYQRIHAPPGGAGQLDHRGKTHPSPARRRTMSTHPLFHWTRNSQRVYCRRAWTFLQNWIGWCQDMCVHSQAVACPGFVPRTQHTSPRTPRSLAIQCDAQYPGRWWSRMSETVASNAIPIRENGSSFTRTSYRWLCSQSRFA